MNNEQTEFENAVEDWKYGARASSITVFIREAQLGNPEAQYMLAQTFHYPEWGIRQDAEQAIYWYRKADEAGHAHAARDLGILFDPDIGQETLEVEPNRELALFYFTKAIARYKAAAQRGDAAAMNQLALCYQLCLGVPADKKKALQWRMAYAFASPAHVKLAVARALLCKPDPASGIHFDHAEKLLDDVIANAGDAGQKDEALQLLIRISHREQCRLRA